MVGRGNLSSEITLVLRNGWENIHRHAINQGIELL